MTQSKNFLALALAVLPASVSAGHCYVQYQTGKAGTGAASANWVATDGTEAYIVAAAGKWAAYSTALATSPPVVSAANIAEAAKPADLRVARTYFKESTCTTSLHSATAKTGFAGVKGDNMVNILGTTALAIDGQELGATAAGTLDADAATLAVASPRVMDFAALQTQFAIDFGLDTSNLGGANASNDGLILSDPRSTTPIASKTGVNADTTGASNGACMKLATDAFYVDATVDGLTTDTNVMAATGAGLELMYWGKTGSYKAAGKIATKLDAVTATASENLSRPTHVTAKITATNTIAVTYHKLATGTSECTTANAVEWPAAAGDCHAVHGVTHADCTGAANACVADVTTALAHFVAKTADDCKAFAATGDLGRCSSKCLCPSTKVTKDALQRLMSHGNDNNCTQNGWYAKLGLVNPGKEQPTNAARSVASRFDVAAVALLNASTTGMGNCASPIAGEATGDADLLTDYLGTHGFDGAKPAACKTADTSTGAVAQFAPITGVLLMIGAALL